MTTLYIDLDGTILDVRQRMYSVYRDSVTSLGGMSLSPVGYCRRKRDGFTDADIVASESLDIKQYNREKQLRLYAIEYLRMDTVIPGAYHSLISMKEDNIIVLVTMRSNPVTLKHQLQELSIDMFLDKVISQGSHDGFNKYDMLLCDEYLDPDDSIIIGDTAGDILTGKRLHIGTVAVLSGVRGYGVLAKCHPDRIVKDITRITIESGRVKI